MASSLGDLFHWLIDHLQVQSETEKEVAKALVEDVEKELGIAEEKPTENTATDSEPQTSGTGSTVDEPVDPVAVPVPPATTEDTAPPETSNEGQ